MSQYLSYGGFKWLNKKKMISLMQTQLVKIVQMDTY